MRQPQFSLNMVLPLSLNALRLHRYINTRLARTVPLRVKSGERRYRMAHAANARRLDQDRLFPFNPFRNRRRKCS